MDNKLDMKSGTAVQYKIIPAQSKENMGEEVMKIEINYIEERKIKEERG